MEFHKEKFIAYMRDTFVPMANRFTCDLVENVVDDAVRTCPTPDALADRLTAMIPQVRRDEILEFIKQKGRDPDMGLTIRCKKTGRSVDMSSAGFMRLRRKISDLYGGAWADHYRTLTDTPPGARDDAWYAAFDDRTVKFVTDKKIPLKLANFFLQSDIEGRITYGTCNLLLRVIGDYDDESVRYGYAGRPDCAAFRDFKQILRDCSDHKCPLTWS